MSRRQQWRAIAALLLTSAFLAGSVHAYVGAAKSVLLVVDGRPERVATMTRTVAELLAHQDVAVGPRDVITPALDTALTDHGVVTVKIARPVTLDIDGRVGVHYVTALDVDTALSEIGVASDAYVNLARSAAIPVEGAALTVRLPKRIVFSVAGKRQALTTPAPTVRAAIREAGIKVGELDRVSVPLAQSLRKGMLITVTRVQQARVTRTETIRFASKRVYDKNMLEYKRVVKSQGRNGLKRTTYLVTYENGKVAKRAVVQSQVIRQPTTAVVVIGTKKRTLEQLNWTRLGKCESHNNPRAVSRGGLYHGIFQFSLTAWKSVGGTGKPSQASAAEQLMRAKLLYVKRGASPWPHCGRLLFTD
jgi:uncharacterized protein YabE (DUF348 family)